MKMTNSISQTFQYAITIPIVIAATTLLHNLIKQVPNAANWLKETVTRCSSTMYYSRELNEEVMDRRKTVDLPEITPRSTLRGSTLG